MALKLILVRTWLSSYSYLLLFCHYIIVKSFNFIYATATSSCKATGVQTDDTGVFSQVFSNDLLASQDLSKKLLAIWGLHGNQILGRNVISDLLVACQTDFHVLLPCMGMNLPVISRMDSPACESSNVDMQYHVHSQHTLEAEKVSHLYSVLTKVLQIFFQNIMHNDDLHLVSIVFVV